MTAAAGERYDVIVVGGGQAGLALGHFLARDGRRFAILEAADAAEDAIAAAEPLVEGLAASLADARHLFVTGGGLGHPAALEAALKLKEMALVHAEGAEVWEMTSGAATMLGPESVLIALVAFALSITFLSITNRKQK